MKKCEALERESSAQEVELTKARQSAEAARNEARDALQEIQEAKKIAAGKAFNMQSKYAERKYLLLTRIWSCPGAFVDLPHSVSDAAEFFRAREFHGEAVLVAVCCARTSGALCRSTETVGRAAQGGQTGHEGFNNPAVASRSYT